MFKNRREAGKLLAEELKRYAKRLDVIVLGLPRGGVPVAHEVANALKAPLDVFLVRKLGFPGQEELALGAIASGGVRVLNSELYGIGQLSEVLEKITQRETAELERREELYRAGKKPLDLKNKIAILVDDGLATGTTMRAAVAALRELKPAKIVIAVPVGAAQACADLRKEADELICLFEPQDFLSVGTWYEDFSQTTDDEVLSILNQLHAFA
jgi:predicted phosphoribosyltransferase